MAKIDGGDPTTPHPRQARSHDARHDFTAPMFRVVRRESRRGWTILRATPTTFGLLGRVVATALTVGPLVVVIALLARAPQDADGQFRAFFFVVGPATVAFAVMVVPPLWRPGRRYRRPAPEPTSLSRRGTRSSSSRSAPR